MNSKNYLNSKSARFSDEIEGEGMELFLRGLLVACLLSALAICNLSIVNGHYNQSTSVNDAAVTLVAKQAANNTSAKL